MPQEPTGAKRPVEPAQDDVEKFLTEQKPLEAHRHELIKDLLRQKEAAIKAFDEKLAKLRLTTATTPRSAATTRHDAKKGRIATAGCCLGPSHRLVYTS